MVLLSYLDNSATTRPTEGVIEAMARCMRDGYFNPSSLYAPALDAEKAMRGCREQIASALNVKSGGIFFASGGTEANNLAILGAMAARRGPQHAIVTAVEHPSVLESFAELGRLGHRVTVLRVDASGQPDWGQLEAALRDAPALVSCMQVNNETGALPDMKRLTQMVRAAAPDALIHVDGVQGFLRVPFDARDVDLYALSAHKIHGPKGIGALYVRPGVRILPRQLGGGQEGALRSGTENTPGIAGFSRAIAEMCALSGSNDSLMERKRLMHALFMDAVPGAIVNGPEVEAGAPHILNISFPGVRGEVMLHALEGAGVYASTGSACSSKKRKLSQVLTAMGIPPERAECALRFSLSPYTTQEEIRYAAAQLQVLHATLKRYGRR